MRLICQIINITGSQSFRHILHFPVEFRHTHGVCFSEIHESANDLCHFRAKIVRAGVQLVHPPSATVSWKDLGSGTSISLHPRESDIKRAFKWFLLDMYSEWKQNVTVLKQWFSTEGNCCPAHPKNIWQCLETFLVAQIYMGCVLMVSSEWRPGMMLKILKCTEQPSTMKNYPTPNVNSAKCDKFYF